MRGFRAERQPADRVGSRGSVLLAALIFVAVLGLSLTSFLVLSQQTVKISDRSVFLTAAHDLAETGLEHGLWAMNQSNSGSATAWSGWTINGADATRVFDGFAFSGGITGSVKVLVRNYSGGSSPTIVARSRIGLNSGGQVETWLTIGIATRSLFSYGLLARNTITMSGGAFMDSWNSDPDNNDLTPAVGWSSSVARDNARLATASSATPSISIGSADIYGTAAVGSSSTTALSMSWGGQIGPRGMAIAGSYNAAPGAITTNFSAAFETVDNPTGCTVRSAYQLPRSVSGPPYYLSTETIGSDGTTTKLQMDSLTVDGAATLTIRGDVTLFLPPSVLTTLKVAGSGRIVLASGASLKIYTPGNINVSGAGITNPSAPKNLQIWSTRNGSSGQSIILQGSGALNALIYAPDASLSLPGSTDFSGAAIVAGATLSGSGAYHFDEALLRFGSGGSLKIASYGELSTPTNRAPYATALNF